jgi:hypothetical protein
MCFALVLFRFPVHNMVGISFENILATCKIMICVLYQGRTLISPQKMIYVLHV